MAERGGEVASGNGPSGGMLLAPTGVDMQAASVSATSHSHPARLRLLDSLVGCDKRRVCPDGTGIGEGAY